MLRALPTAGRAAPFARSSLHVHGNPPEIDAYPLRGLGHNPFLHSLYCPPPEGDEEVHGSRSSKYLLLEFTSSHHVTVPRQFLRRSQNRDLAGSATAVDPYELLAAGR